MKKIEQLNELINSGITLTDNEAHKVEQYLWSINKPVSRKYLNTVKIRTAINAGK